MFECFSELSEPKRCLPAAAYNHKGKTQILQLLIIFVIQFLQVGPSSRTALLKADTLALRIRAMARCTLGQGGRTEYPGTSTTTPSQLSCK